MYLNLTLLLNLANQHILRTISLSLSQSMNITLTKIPLLELVSVHLSFIHIWSSETPFFFSFCFICFINYHIFRLDCRKFIQIFECIVEYEALI